MIPYLEDLWIEKKNEIELEERWHHLSNSFDVCLFDVNYVQYMRDIIRGFSSENAKRKRALKRSTSWNMVTRCREGKDHFEQVNRSLMKEIDGYKKVIHSLKLILHVHRDLM